jgi:hypothetical protein
MPLPSGSLVHCGPEEEGGALRFRIAPEPDQGRRGRGKARTGVVTAADCLAVGTSTTTIRVSVRPASMAGKAAGATRGRRP